MSLGSLDQANSRYALLDEALDRLNQRAQSDPLDQRYLDINLVKLGETKAQARQSIATAVAKAKTRIRHLCLIDLCGEFEARAIEWIETAIGESRRVVNKHYSINLLKDIKERLVKEPEHFGSFDSILKLVEGKISAPDMSALHRLREQRNRSAHGMDLDLEPNISITEARQMLEKLMDRLESTLP